MLKTIAAGFAFIGLTFALGTAAQAAGSMPTRGVTSQPIGHYEFCQRFADTCQRTGSDRALSLDEGAWKALVAVNEAVNANIIARTDAEIFGRDEYWTYPEVQGDCEDFALLKQYMLQQRGVPASALLITVLRQPNGAGHAVLTVRTDRGDFILDNLDERVLRWDATPYTYLKRQDATDHGRWVEIEDSRDVLVGSVR